MHVGTDRGRLVETRVRDRRGVDSRRLNRPLQHRRVENGLPGLTNGECVLTRDGRAGRNVAEGQRPIDDLVIARQVHDSRRYVLKRGTAVGEAGAIGVFDETLFRRLAAYELISPDRQPGTIQRRRGQRKEESDDDRHG